MDCSTNSLGQTTNSEYDANGNLNKPITANGNMLTTHYNKLNQITDIFISGKMNFSYVYDVNGKKVLDNGIQTKHYQYYKNGHSRDNDIP